MAMSHVSTENMSKCAKCRHYCRTGATFIFSHIGLCGLVFGYTVMGAFTFEFLEAPNELARRQEVLDETHRVVKHLWQLTDKSEYLNESSWSENATNILESFEKKLIHAVRKEGFDGNLNLTSYPQWSFSGSLLYSIIVITTIGYGNIAPKTDTGKIVTILYALVGIPLLLLCLSNIGDAMAHSFKFIYWKVCCYLCTSPKSQTHHKRNRSSRYTSDVKNDTLQSTSTTSAYGGSLRRKPFNDPTTTSSMYDKSYMSAGTSHSLPRTHQSRQGHSSDSKVPVISNRYILNLAESQVNQLQRQMTMGGPSPYHHPMSTPYVRNPPQLPKIQDPSQFLPIMDSEDYEESLSDESEKETDGEQANVPIMLCVSIVVGYICGGAILFSSWEGWDYSDSSYFCFITLTTIGFGDMVPGTSVLSEDAQLALGLCSLYLLFGMALLAMSFNLVQEEVTKLVTNIGRRIGILAQEEGEDSDDDE